MENKLYKYERHCHTGCVSRCGRVEPEEIVKLYIEKGYDGIVVTDHYSPMTFKPNWCPQKQIDFYLSGYRRMKAEAEKSGKDFTVLLGMELRHYGTANDYLIYGISLQCRQFDEAVGKENVFSLSFKRISCVSGAPV